MSEEQLRDLSVEKLHEKLLVLRKEQFKIRLQKATGQLNQTHLMRQVRRDIARVKTLLTEKVGTTV